MTLRQALIRGLKSGRRIRRGGEEPTGWYTVDEMHSPFTEEGVPTRFGFDAMTAKDWELEPEKKLLSAEDIRAAYKRAYGSATDTPNLFRELFKELGLE